MSYVKYFCIDKCEDFVDLNQCDKSEFNLVVAGEDGEC
jgi:hypothetical protein